MSHARISFVDPYTSKAETYLVRNCHFLTTKICKYSVTLALKKGNIHLRLSMFDN